MAYNGIEIFERFGVFVEWFNLLSDQSNNLDNPIFQKAIDRFDSGSGERESVTKIGNAITSQRGSVAAMGRDVVDLTAGYITSDLRATLNSTNVTSERILQDLIEAMNEASPPDTVKGNVISASTPQKDPDNHRSDGTASNVTISQMARANNLFVVECSDDTNVDGELWTVQSSKTGFSPNQLTTDEVFGWDAAGVTSFKIDTMPIKKDGDSLSQLANIDLSGILRPANTDDGTIYVEIEKTPSSIIVVGDENGQLTNWAVSGAGLANTDNGRSYVSLQRYPSTYLMTNDDSVILLNWALVGATYGGNTDPDGLLYASVTLSGSTYTVAVYSDPQQTSKVAEGATSATLPANIALSEQNSSGLSGSVRLEAFSADADAVTLEVPFHYVRLYKSPTRGIAPLMAQGVSFTRTATGVNLTEENGSGLSGTVDLDYGQDDNDIELEIPLHFIRFYRSDISGLDADEKSQLLIAQGASESATKTGITVESANGTTVVGELDLSYSADTDTISLQVGWQIGDRWSFETSSSDAGVFQNFFRDNLGVTLPNKTDGSETIPDSLAQ